MNTAVNRLWMRPDSLVPARTGLTRRAYDKLMKAPCMERTDLRLKRFIFQPDKLHLKFWRRQNRALRGRRKKGMVISMSMSIGKRQIVLATLVVALGAAVFVNWYYTKPDAEKSEHRRDRYRGGNAGCGQFGGCASRQFQLSVLTE